MKNLRLVLWGLVTLAVVGLGVGLVLQKRHPALVESDHAALMPVTEDAFGGPFALTDQDGKPTTDKDLTGRYRLIYFGFTFCPAICPTELAKMTKALAQLGPEAEKIQPVFVTVDPERDTPEKMKSYVALFDPRLIGLTGTPEQTKAMLKAYKIYAAKVEDPQLSDYTMDHSSFIYLMAPDDRLLHIFKAQDSADDIARIVGAWLAQMGA